MELQPAEGVVALAGDLGQLPLVQLIQFFHLQGKDGVLRVEAASRPVAGLYYQKRDIIHAVCRTQVGTDAVYDALKITSGGFRFVTGDVHVPARTVRDSVQNLILEGMRRLEEDSHVTGLLPSDEKPLYLAPEPPRDDIRLTAREWSVLSLVNGKRTIAQIVEASGRTSAECRSVLAGLFTADLIVDQKNDSYLDEIVLRADEPSGLAVRYAASTLVGTLLLKRIDGRRTLRDLLRELKVEEGTLAEDLRLLVRTGRVAFVSGEGAFRRWAAS